ncbi:hypothetical protein UlMin_034886 [Ulmus minor]
MASTPLNKIDCAHQMYCEGRYKKALAMATEECTSVLELVQNHTGALMLQAQTLATLKEYHSVLFDVNRLIELNPSLEVYQNLEPPLRMQLNTPLAEVVAHQAQPVTRLLEKDSKGWQAIPKPKGYSTLDYGRWNTVEDDDDDDDDDEEDQPQDWFHVKTVRVRPVK